MAAKARPVLVVHCGDSYWADQIVKKLQHNFNIQAITLQDVLLSGRPLNLRDLIDNADTVLFLDDKHLFDDSITSALAFYCKKVGKVKPICFDKPGTRFLVEFRDFRIVTYSESLNDSFWSLLTAFILIKMKL